MAKNANGGADSNKASRKETPVTKTANKDSATVAETRPADSSAASDPEAERSVQSKQDPLDKYTAHYPAWAREFARKYFTKTFTQFILHGNVRDLVPSADENGNAGYIPLRPFLTDDLFGSRDIVILYDRSSGIHFVDQASQKDFNRALSGYDTIFGTEYAQKLPKDPVRVLSVLENYFRLRLAEGKRIACIVDYAETIVPMAEASTYSSEDRNTLVFLAKWSHDPLFLKS
ncbi:MAG: hypothetical protein KDD65_00235, partial [Bacteroidetes bacterium]|nr:hypothetical protein [Bacteroidota bacterium]